MFRRIGRWGRIFRKDTRVLWFAFSDPETSWWIRISTLLLAIYAISPLDLIPDVVPVVGWLDDIIIIPLGISFLVSRLPQEIKKRCYVRSKNINACRLIMLMIVSVTVIWLIVLWVRR
ncbi:MAG: hypothetical protein XXXJIFNMEKO3_01797 [Candidatus Erwinia impunctatus]|nr:hypothetical protein XXXJIFNMEKO_01797 [Culicoides impunctatus]